MQKTRIGKERDEPLHNHASAFNLRSEQTCGQKQAEKDNATIGTFSRVTTAFNRPGGALQLTPNSRDSMHLFG